MVAIGAMLMALASVTLYLRTRATVGNFIRDGYTCSYCISGSYQRE